MICPHGLMPADCGRCQHPSSQPFQHAASEKYGDVVLVGQLAPNLFAVYEFGPQRNTAAVVERGNLASTIEVVLKQVKRERKEQKGRTQHQTISLGGDLLEGLDL